ncbi:alpha/beta hydrolase family protein [Amycolatopsis sp. YIM 10]|uniref:alpha/beta hydrolase n=1 Tax=Amycolatopsis sp. YIM 10 TaxID=2653857 RepID=UPI00128FCE2C|nr:alpha/beta hydrolase family protein [Amycolatopsis sp. YIM 10]QFU90455.1 Diacylglycerol acyltransferase/mycolyltransferase Ag85B precursor [Amycolatopsis sp. YIM 10]
MLRKALVLLLTLVSLAVTPPALASPGRAVVLEERVLGDRMVELLVRSPALDADVGVRLLLPKDYGAKPGKRWPTLYLLHGCCSAAEGHIEWTTYSDVEDYTKDLNALIVMPEAGDVGFYSDWLSGPAWETFHLTELRRLLEQRYRSGHERAVAGLSMGGFGALSYAARNPGMFRAAASYSGLVHTTFGGEPATTGILNLIAAFGEDPLKLWGDPVAQARIWAAHNPYDLARRLRGIPVFLASGNGEPGPLDPLGAAFDPLEQTLGAQAVVTADRLREVGVKVTTCLYGPGTHTWPYWERELHRSLPMLAKALGVPFTPPEALPAAC